MVKDKTTNPKLNLPTEICVKGESCGNWILPKRYNAKVPNIAIQIAINTSLSSRCICKTKSACDKNLNANANSKNPKTTFTVFNQPPDFGKEFNQLGNSANKAKGKANANPNPVIPAVNCVAPPSEVKELANKEPKIGPVQEKETIAKVNAIKKIPIIPPIEEAESILFPQELGSVIS